MIDKTDKIIKVEPFFESDNYLSLSLRKVLALKTTSLKGKQTS